MSVQALPGRLNLDVAKHTSVLCHISIHRLLRQSRLDSASLPSMDLTTSYERVMPQEVLDRYQIRETRNAAAILRATDQHLFEELVEILDRFDLETNDLLLAGGQESTVARRFNAFFRTRGWREAQVDTEIALKLIVMPFKPLGEIDPRTTQAVVSNRGYKVDNFKNRIALDVEWNAKDGNLDRDISAYRALYDAGLIDVAVIITRTQGELRAFARQLRMENGMPEEEARKMLATTTTTNLEKLEPRMTRGDAGGCPLLAIAISSQTFENSPLRK